jgi:hypothetical protein
MSEQHDDLYFLGWEVTLDGGDRCERFLHTQCIEQRVAEAHHAYIRLEFRADGLLAKGQLCSDGTEVTEGPLWENLGTDHAVGVLKRPAVPVHQVFALIEDERGPHQLGGEVPATVALPVAEPCVPFQYLGHVDPADPMFAWLPFRLHLMAPIFLNISEVFVDYTDPLRPVVLNTEEVKAADCSYEELNERSSIVFKALRVGTELTDEVLCSLGHGRVPAWVQYPHIPRCPKTQRIMRFVMQLRSDAGVEVAHSNVVPSSDFMASYFKEMNFWGDGDLFVFFEPTSRVACYIIQNT